METPEFSQGGEKIRTGTSYRALLLDTSGRKIFLVPNEYSGQLCIPGGRNQAGESVDATLSRELVEETGRSAQVESKVLVSIQKAKFQSPNTGRHYEISNYYFLSELQAGPDFFEDNPGCYLPLEEAYATLQHDHERNALATLISYLQ